MTTAINFIMSVDGQDYHVSLPITPCDWNSFFEALMDHLGLSSMDTPLYYFDSDNNKHPIMEGSLSEILMLDLKDQTSSVTGLSHNNNDRDDLTTKNFGHEDVF